MQRPSEIARSVGFPFYHLYLHAFDDLRYIYDLNIGYTYNTKCLNVKNPKGIVYQNIQIVIITHLLLSI